MKRAKEAGVVVYTVGVGTESGQPVPELDPEGRTTGYKRDESGNAVVSRLDMTTLEAIARGTGGQAFRITPADTSLSGLAAALEGMEQKSLAREFSYRRKERFQVPLAIGLACLALGLLLPLPPLGRKPRARALAVCPGGARGRDRAAAAERRTVRLARRPRRPPPVGRAASSRPRPKAAARRGTLLDEVLLRPRRATEQGRARVHARQPPAGARGLRARGRGPAAGPVRALQRRGRPLQERQVRRGGDALQGARRRRRPRRSRGRPATTSATACSRSRTTRAPSRPTATRCGRLPGDADTRRNLELALRKLKEQEEQQKRDQQQKDDQKQDQDKKDQDKQDQKQGQDQKDQKGEPKPNQQGDKQQRPQTPEEKADERFRQETGMPKERAMQLLDALQQNEKAEQQKALALKRAQRKKGKDW